MTAIAWAVCSPVAASEGAEILYLYYCNPFELTQKLIEECSKLYPELRVPGESVWRGWLERNEVNGRKAADSCRDEYEKLAKAERQAIEEKVRSAESARLTDRIRESLPDGIAGCKKIFRAFEQNDHILGPFEVLRR